MALVDLYIVYSLIKRLATPFEEWEAYKLGIIDENGELIKSKTQRNTTKERESYTILDNVARKLKRIIEKVPGGKSRLATYAAALYLIKEGQDYDEDVLSERLNLYMLDLSEDFVNIQFENMVAGGGLVAGLPPDDPIVTKKSQRQIVRRNFLKKKRVVKV